MVRIIVSSLLVIASCTGSDSRVRPSLDGPYPCGAQTCATGEICVTVESGSMCGVTEDVPPYTVYSYACTAVPPACDGIPDCDCLPGGGALCFGPSEDGRTLAYGCI